MVKTIDLKFKDYKKALKSLDQVLQKEKDDIIRDSAVKRFEYTFELCWKTGKMILSEKFGVEIFSPKECFRELLRNKIVNDEIAEGFLKMTNDRNDIVHAYSEDLSDKLYAKINENYIILFEKLEKEFAKLID